MLFFCMEGSVLYICLAFRNQLTCLLVGEARPDSQRTLSFTAECNWTRFSIVSLPSLEGSSLKSYSLLQPHCMYSTNMCWAKKKKPLPA